MVCALDHPVDSAAAAQMFDRCAREHHAGARYDGRIVGFFQRLRAQFPVEPPYGPHSPWLGTPVSVGVDHVLMHLSPDERADQAIAVIWRLAAEYGLTIWDPQGRTAHQPWAPQRS